ncbi:hypothetical protein BDR06DRAFT_1051105 [Suillus hirtellus]|nr:hypothetical protein BDR06DRAFT_1051105 [Suillus hirtellus]
MEWPTNSLEVQHHVSPFLSVLISSPSEHPSVKCRVISNLFNATLRNSALHLPIYTTLRHQQWRARDFAFIQKRCRVVVARIGYLWGELSQFLKSIVDVFIQSGEPLLLTFDLYYTQGNCLSSHTSSSPSYSPENQFAAVDAVASALRLHALSYFDSLFKLDAIVSAKDHEPFSAFAGVFK